MTRGVAWDDLPCTLPIKTNASASATAAIVPEEVPPHVFNPEKDLIEIGRRIAFGTVCGSITGACFGVVDVLKDPTSMTGRRSIATGKVLRFTYLFAGFFGLYHGVRKTLQYAVPQPLENNIIVAAALSITPLIAIGSLRPLIPYSVMLVAIDAFNEFNDGKS